jgi:hypothetical protein
MNMLQLLVLEEGQKEEKVQIIPDLVTTTLT